MKIIKRIKGVPQENYYTCGCACFRTVLKSLGLTDVQESELESIMNTTHTSGTHYDDMIATGHKFGLDVKHGEQGTIELLDELVEDGWVVVVAYSVGGPHYSVYVGSEGLTISLYDPDMNSTREFQKYIFVKNTWNIDISKYSFFIAEYDLELNPERDNSDKWWVAYKTK